MQAIVTKYIPPSACRGSRVKASAAAGSLTIAFGNEKSDAGNYTAAARALAIRYGWSGQWIGGSTPDQNYVFVWVGPNAQPENRLLRDVSFFVEG